LAESGSKKGYLEFRVRKTTRSRGFNWAKEKLGCESAWESVVQIFEKKNRGIEFS
jgi:hypothetical protein